MSELVQHSSKSNEHYTPSEYVEAGRATMGSIDLDPASCYAAQAVVRAKHFFSKEQNGLVTPWHRGSNVFLNPPGGVVRFDLALFKWVKVEKGPGESNSLVWWNKLCTEWITGNIRSAIFIAFTLEMLRHGQSGRLPLQAFPRCYPRQRIRFIAEDNKPGNSPGHANVIAYLAPKEDDPDVAFFRFSAQFSRFGLCEPGGVTVG